MKNNKKQTPKPKKRNGVKTKAAVSERTVAGEPKAGKKSEETMDRGTLIGIIGQLKGAGVGIKAMKADTDEDLQRKVNEAIQKLPSGDELKLLESVDPNKLVTVLQRDCIGLFVDFSDVSCIRCPDASTCVSQFLKNLRAMPDLSRAMPEADKAKAEAKPTLVPVTRYAPGRPVWVRDVPNPNPKGDDYYDTIQRILTKQPENLEEMREIVQEDFDLESDGDFMKFVTAMRDPKEGIIKLDVDLSDADKVALHKAGYEVK